MSSSSSIVYFNFKMSSNLKIQSEVAEWLLKIMRLENRKKPSVILYHLVVLFGYDSAEL